MIDPMPRLIEETPEKESAQPIAIRTVAQPARNQPAAGSQRLSPLAFTYLASVSPAASRGRECACGASKDGTGTRAPAAAKNGASGSAARRPDTDISRPPPAAAVPVPVP
jgi:hypothetical protein